MLEGQGGKGREGSGRRGGGRGERESRCRRGGRERGDRALVEGEGGEVRESSGRRGGKRGRKSSGKGRRGEGREWREGVTSPVKVSAGRKCLIVSGVATPS